MRSEVMNHVKNLGETALPHLCQDKEGDVFILTKRMEIYCFSKTTLGGYCYHRKTYLQLLKTGLIFNVHELDDPIVNFHTDRANLPLLLSLGTFKRRPHRNGKWIKKKELLLGHDIRPMNISNSELRKMIKE